MNKKLFSWKALAGLALLVAMGLTSCKQDTVVDPTDPYNTTKPVKPSSKIDGDYDWEVSITKTADLAAQWKTVSKDVIKAVAAAESDVVNIKINCGNYALDGEELSIPDLFNGAVKGKTVNVVFSGAFKSKTVDDVEKALDVTLGNLTGADVNIFLPADQFKMVLDARGTKTTLSSESTTTLKTLYAKADAVKKNALTIEDEVTVSGISMDGALVATTDNILAKLVTGTESLEKGKGATVGKKDIAAVFVKNLILTGNTKVSGADEAALENITIPENMTLTLGSKKSQIESIVGLGTAKKPSTVAFAGDKDDFSNIGSLTNVTLSGATATNITDFDIFENVIFSIPVNLYASAANTEFLDKVNVKFGDDVDEIAFANVNFGSKTVMTVSGATKTTSKMKSVAMYQWDKTKKNYVEIDDEKDVYDTNTDYVEIVQAIYTAKAYATAMKADSLTMTDGKFTFPALVTAKEALDVAQKKYEAMIDAYGVEAANGGPDAENTLGTITPSQELKDYIDAWEVVNGVCDYEIYSKDAKGNWLDKDGKITTDKTKRVPVKAAPAKKEKQGAMVGLVGTDAYAFMTAVNAKIGDADWFEIYYATEVTTTPEDVTVSFDADCTIGDADITLKKLNKMINVDDDDYSSWRDIFFDVVYDGETYQWAGDKTNGFYLK
ncbi:MAG: hypothetical protein IJV20_07040 [Prevotella sp.]|nr:hypothetical protein [Prevotella sp.]